MEEGLYVVATPLGNLEDITLRALKILREVDLIAAEDTRHTRKLLTHYDITTPLTSYYDSIETRKSILLLRKLQAGFTVALVSDAGTPCIADPGYELVAAAVEEGFPVTPIPGPAMVTSLLSVGGLPTDRFVFEGFLPAKRSQRYKRFEELAHEDRTLVFYESPRRLVGTLEDLVEVFGDRRIVIGREITKRFEEILRGRGSEVIAKLQKRAVKGEVSLLVEGASSEVRPVEAVVRKMMSSCLSQGVALKVAARAVSGACGIPRRDAYELGLRIKDLDME